MVGWSCCEAFGESERVYDTYADAVDHAGAEAALTLGSEASGPRDAPPRLDCCPALLTLNLELHRRVPIERDRRCLH